VLATRADVDIADAASIDAALATYSPWAVFNAAGYVRVDEAEADAARCRRENVVGPTLLAEACARRDIPLVTFSSDLVFDGRKAWPYVESDAASPLNVYGETKAEAEERVLAAHDRALVVRTSAFFGPWDEWNFAHVALRELEAGRTFVAAEDAFVSPTYVPDLVNGALDLLIDGESGLWHLANAGVTSWASFARDVARAANVDTETLVAVPARKMSWPAKRPRYSALGSERGPILATLEDALERFVSARRPTAALGTAP